MSFGVRLKKLRLKANKTIMQEQAKEKIKALVEKYEKIKSSGKLKSY